MIVCVETNFVLEVALGQEQAGSAGEVLTRAQGGEVELAILYFSLVEPFSTVTKRHRDRKHLSNALGNQAQELKRSAPHQQDAIALEPLVSVLVQIGQHETDRLVTIVEQLLEVATVIQTDLPIFRNAMRYRSTYGLTEQDAIIYASIVSHLAGRSDAGPHYFVSKNWRDFSDPEIEQELGHLNCTFVAEFSFIADLLRLDQRPAE